MHLLAEEEEFATPVGERFILERMTLHNTNVKESFQCLAVIFRDLFL